MNCPICKTEFQSNDAFCQKCGYEIHILPVNISDAVHEYEKTRAERYKETWNALNNNKNTVAKLEDENSTIQNELNGKAQELKEKDNQYKRLNSQFITLQKEIESLVQVEDKQKESLDLPCILKEIREQISDNLRRKEVINQLESNLKEANITIFSLQRQIDKIKNSAVHPIAFLVMSQEENITAIYNILEGENSFGYAKSRDRHQQIICNAQISDVHFSIRAISAADAKGRSRTKFFVTPKDGQLFGSSNCSNKISSERELQKNESVYIDNVKFTLVANK